MFKRLSEQCCIGNIQDSGELNGGVMSRSQLGLSKRATTLLHDGKRTVLRRPTVQTGHRKTALHALSGQPSCQISELGQRHPHSFLFFLSRSGIRINTLRGVHAHLESVTLVGKEGFRNHSDTKRAGRQCNRRHGSNGGKDIDPQSRGTFIYTVKEVSSLLIRKKAPNHLVPTVGIARHQASCDIVPQGQFSQIHSAPPFRWDSNNL